MKNDDRKELLEFLTSNEAPPVDLKDLTQKDILFTMNKSSILLKFVSLQILGAALTLSFCPQFGAGLPEGHRITHTLRMYGDWACATFCGSLFLLAGSLLASIAMNSDQYYWIWKRYKLQLIILPTLFWSALMFFNLTWKLDSETVSNHIIWLISAIFTQEAAVYLKSKMYQGVFKRIA